MKMQLKKPCRNCPFANTPERIRFRNEERAAEIAETAYRRGFPCHKSAEYQEDEDYGEGGYVFGPDTQHCAGALGTLANDYLSLGSAWPAIDNDEDVAEAIIKRLGDNLSICFESEEAFIAANKDDRA